MGRVLPLFLVLWALASSFTTYYLVTMVIFHNSSGGKLLFGSIIETPEKTRNKGTSKAPFHVAVTTSADTYSKWQCRIMYYWYKKKKGLQMGGFTRILQSRYPDNLMDEIPTVVVDPLPAGLDRGYIVLNRPWAFVQWLEKSTIVEEYVLMAEPDHIFVNPLPNLADGRHPAAFPFTYINPIENEKIVRKFYPKENGKVSNIDPIGNSPVIIRKDLLMKIAPTWMELALKMKEDPETDKTLGWVLEMYAYAIASALHGVWHTLREDFMLQPPWDRETDEKFILHYTYQLNYNLKGEMMLGRNGEWRFDKRSYLFRPPPRNLSLPPPGTPESVKQAEKKMGYTISQEVYWMFVSFILEGKSIYPSRRVLP